MQLEAKTLHLLKVVVHREDLGEDRAYAASNDLCPVHLSSERHSQSVHS